MGLVFERKPACAHGFFCQKDSCWVGRLWGCRIIQQTPRGHYCVQAGCPGESGVDSEASSISRVLGGHESQLGIFPGTGGSPLS